MLTLNKTPKTISEQEKDAELAEGRKNSLEGEIVSLGESKKVLEKSILNIKEEIKTDNVKLQEGKDKIFKINEDILEIQNSLRLEEQKITELEKNNKEKLEQIQKEIDKKNTEKESLNSKIIDISKKFELDKFNNSQEIKDLKLSKDSLISSIEKLKIEKEQNIQETNLSLEKSNEIQKEVKKLIENKVSLESSNLSLSNTIEDQKGNIRNNKGIIDNQDIVIKDKEIIIDNLQVDIEKKKEEYKSIEQQAFSILNKQQILDQKTAFIKGQYERAGIKWEE